MNALIEASSNAYHERMVNWVDVALEEGVRFFVTSLGNPRWVVEKAHAVGGIVYHDVTERKWAVKGLAAGVDGLIAVNSRAGGHAGPKGVEELWNELAASACRSSAPAAWATSSISSRRSASATPACRWAPASSPRRSAPRARYKQAIVAADEDDIVLTERLTGVPVAVIRTPLHPADGHQAGAFGRWMLRGRKTKHWMRTIYSLQSLWKLKRSLDGRGARTTGRPGRAWGHPAIEPAGEIVKRFAAAAP